MAGSGRAEYVSDVSGGHLFGIDSRMYSIWFPLEELQRGRSVMVSAREESDLTAERITQHFESMSEVFEIVPLKRGKPAKSFFYRFARKS